MELDYKAIGKRIKIARIKADMKQDQLAERAKLSPTHVSNVETGTTKVNLHWGKAVLVGMGVLFQPVHVGGIALYKLLINSNIP